MLRSGSACRGGPLWINDGRSWGALVMVLALLPGAVRAESVRTVETEETFRVVDKGGANPRDLKLRRIRMENAYLRVDLLPQLGGRVRSVFDKAAGKELFLLRPIEWPATRYTAYGSQLGGHEVNFPSFHHGNNYMDQWNWRLHRDADRSASVTVGWTDPLRRQRVVVRGRAPARRCCARTTASPT